MRIFGEGMPGDNIIPDDDLDSFFAAADSNDPDAIRNAAQSIHQSQVPPSSPALPNARRGTSIFNNPEEPKGKTSTAQLVRPDLFVAIDAQTDEDEDGSQPFVLIPANIHRAMPLWGWAALALVLAGIFAAIVALPSITLNRLTASLGSNNDAAAQTAMRKLVIRGDEKTVDKLYEVAVSVEEEMRARLRAVDALSIIDNAAADRALLRLELAGGVDADVKAAAARARKQRAVAR